MPNRARPPDDISPRRFFTHWLAESVAADGERREQLGDTCATIFFELLGEGGGAFTVEIADGVVCGEEGRGGDPNLHVTIDVETWRQLNRGELSAPHALLKRRLRVSGDLLLALKLHLILG